jgi:hypothetical protein
MEKMVGEREDEKSRRNAFANFGLRTTTAISVYFLGNLAIYTSSLFFGGPDLVEGVISAAAAARLFLFGSTVAIFITSMSASQRSKEHPAEYWGAMFLHGMDVSTSVVHRRISFACYALAVFLLIPSVWVVDKAQGWGSVGGETVEFRLDTQDNYLVTAADGKMRRIENTPLHPFFKSGSLKRRSDNAVIISPTAHLMDLGGDGLDYRIRKDGSIRSVVDSNELGSPNKVAQNTQSNGGFWHGLLSSLLF